MQELFHTLLAVSISANDIGAPAAGNGISGILVGILNIVMLLVGLLSVVAVVFGGLQMVLSAGDPGRFKTGRQTVTYAVFGLIVAIFAFAIVRFITGALA